MKPIFKRMPIKTKQYHLSWLVALYAGIFVSLPSHADEVTDKLDEVQQMLSAGESNRAKTVMSIAKLHASLKWQKADTRLAYLHVIEAQLESNLKNYVLADSLYEKVLALNSEKGELFIPKMQSYLGLARLAYLQDKQSEALSWSAKARQFAKADILARKTLSLAYNELRAQWQGYIWNFGSDAQQISKIRVRTLSNIGTIISEWHVMPEAPQILGYQSKYFAISSDKVTEKVAEIALDFLK